VASLILEASFSVLLYLGVAFFYVSNYQKRFLTVVILPGGLFLFIQGAGCLLGAFYFSFLFLAPLSLTTFFLLFKLVTCCVLLEPHDVFLLDSILSGGFLLGSILSGGFLLSSILPDGFLLGSFLSAGFVLGSILPGTALFLALFYLSAFF
jgi:hypothetical protein